MTQQVLTYFQIGVAILLGTTILLQQKGQGLSGAFGGEGSFYRTKRGLEKTLLIATIVFAVVFVGIGISRIALSPSAIPTPLVSDQSSGIPASDLGTEPIIDENAISIPEMKVKTEPVFPSAGQN